MKRLVSLLCLFWSMASAVQADVGLVDVWRMALQHDPQLAQARAQYEADLRQLDRARAALLPQVEASASLTRTETDLPASAGDVRTRRLSLNLQQALYNRKAFVARDLAEKQVEIARVTWHKAQQDLMLRVAEAYFQVLQAQAAVRVTEVLVHTREEQAMRAKLGEEVGITSEVDVLQAASGQAQSRADLIKARNALEVAYQNLAQLTGRRLTRLKGIDMARSPALPLGAERQWLDAALARNLQLRLAQLNEAVAAMNVALEKSGHYPTVGLAASVTDTAYADYDNRYAAQFPDSQTRQVSIQMNMPIYSGGGVSATVDRARALQRKALAGEEAARQQVTLQVKVLFHDLQNGQALIEALQKTVEASQAFLERARESYLVGKNSMLDVLDAQSRWHRARLDLIEAVQGQLLNWLKLQALADRLDEPALQQVSAYLTRPAEAE